MTDQPGPGSGLAQRLDGLLFFPVTAFDSGGAVNLDAYRQHVKTRLAAGPGAIFACCGTGEFFSLGLAEYADCVRVAVQEAAGRVPVVAGVGYGVPLATEFGRAAAEAGADAAFVRAGCVRVAACVRARAPVDSQAFARPSTLRVPDSAQTQRPSKTSLPQLLKKRTAFD